MFAQLRQWLALGVLLCLVHGCAQGSLSRLGYDRSKGAWPTKRALIAHPLPESKQASPFSKPSPGVQKGLVSWYGDAFAGRKTASGEIYQPQELTAAHPEYPFGTRVRVTLRQTGKSVVVRINDRGPFVPGRVMDLSKASAEKIGLTGVGEAEYAVLD